MPLLTIHNSQNPYQLHTELDDLIPDLQTLQDYDTGSIGVGEKHDERFSLTAQDALEKVAYIKSKLTEIGKASDIFGAQREKGVFEGIINGLYLSFDSKPVYPFFEDRIAHLFYFIIKDHPFIDGNKRVAVSLYRYYYYQNLTKYKTTQGEWYVPDTTALALHVAQSNPDQKKLIIDLITSNTQRDFTKSIQINK